MLGRAKVRGVRTGVLVMLVASVAFAVGCSGKTESGDDGEDGDAGEGTSTGGRGFGGTTSSGGTAGSATGGTGAVNGSCLSLCQRVQMCPDVTPVDCATDCADLEAEAATAGCTTAYRNFIACWSATSDVCSLETSGCDAVILDYVNCLEGSGGGGGNCMPGSVPVNTSCSSLCPRLAACPDPSPTCEADCAESEADAAGAGCASQYQAFMGCASTCADICSLADGDCSPEISDYITCFTTFCTANPAAPPCM
jgi:hypothetical protein